MTGRLSGLHVQPDRLAPALGLAGALVALLYLMWPAFGARFSVIDDHEIIDIIGRRGRLPLTDLLPTVVERSDESVGRFRPVYWLGRALEAATAGMNPTWWHVDRFALAAVTLTAIYLTAVRFVHPVVAALLSLLPFAGDQFETWDRLGPNEAYALPLLCVGIAVLVRALVAHRPPRHLWPGYLLLILSGLAKESFILAGLVITLWTVWHVGLRRLTRTDWMVAGGTATIMLLDIAVVAIASVQRGPVYQQSRTPASAYDWGRYVYHSVDHSAYLKVGVVALVVLAVVVGRQRFSARVAVELAAASAALVGLQVAFYAGGPTVGRYLYPSVLVGVLLWAVVAVLIGLIRSPKTARVTLGLLVVFLLLPVTNGIRDGRTAGAGVAVATVSFTENLAKIERRAEAADAKVIVVQPREPASDYERVLALSRYLTNQTDLEVMTLRAPGIYDRSSDPLAMQLRSWSADGYDRLEPLTLTDDCFSIVFGRNRPVCPDWARSPG